MNEVSEGKPSEVARSFFVAFAWIYRSPLKDETLTVQ